MTTVDCLADLIDEITKALDEENYAIISIFLDLSEGFDRSTIISYYQNLTFMAYETLKISGLGLT